MADRNSINMAEDVKAWIRDAIADLGSDASPDEVSRLLVLRHFDEAYADEALIRRMMASAFGSLIDELFADGTLTPEMPNDVAAHIVMAEMRRRIEVDPPPAWN